uniref:Uncharacterized protein n=1 Tax=Rhizophora mucronata TaxID=61149 RepID=A0A2P2PLV9_RHIMU
MVQFNFFFLLLFSYTFIFFFRFSQFHEFLIPSPQTKPGNLGVLDM